MDVSQTFMKAGELDPEVVYLSLRGENTYLLESIEGSEKMARYSFIGFNPAAKITVKDGHVDFKAFNGDFTGRPVGDDPLTAIKSLVEDHSQRGPSLARFGGGFVGYLGYDAIRYYVELEDSPDVLNQPDAEFFLTRNNIIFDHVKKETYFVENHFMPSHEIDVEESLRELESIAFAISEADLDENVSSNGFESNTTKHEYEESVRAVKKYVYDGDIFQAVISQRLMTDYAGDKFNAYLRLKDINPSPYMYYLDFGDRKIVGSSPETLARVEGHVVSTYPIAGTRRRGRTGEDDRHMEEDMLADPKERAEHVMLVDLGRNDVGKVSEYGSVNVTKFMEVERYSHVMHMSSEVTGKLRLDLSEYDALQSIFPAGTVSGAPKVRAMEIINELEPDRRGVYAGCVGYFSFNRTLDTAIAIRTVIFEKDRAYVQAGAGIVADSQPELEYKETMNKGRALLKALGVEG
ncbi:MAG: anthranilate synthase component I [Candidatus Altiarchaeales archaeon]|nr:anthranilate synthase component I [Candidatus Altiarchaeales archaeon]MBD3415936.1 anthranilate synthase component I [Candidatus Altiarchaeales archaeon]